MVDSASDIGPRARAGFSGRVCGNVVPPVSAGVVSKFFAETYTRFFATFWDVDLLWEAFCGWSGGC